MYIQYILSALLVFERWTTVFENAKNQHKTTTDVSQFSIWMLAMFFHLENGISHTTWLYLLNNKYFYFGCISLNIACKFKCYNIKIKVLSECNDLYFISIIALINSFYITLNQTVCMQVFFGTPCIAYSCQTIELHVQLLFVYTYSRNSIGTYFLDTKYKLYFRWRPALD
jgi:hypothetical protein